ncbi:MAG: adenosylmethionine decarboxylase [bacterium]|nr:MAG: adenosylmethionine decarboxylase [bacterium]
MKTSGIQLIAEFNGCPANILNDENMLKQAVIDGIQAHGFHEVNTFSHQFDPIGVTVVSIISESHVAIHTYPEANHASIDIFHCSNESQPLFALLNFLEKKLKPKKRKFMEIFRGKKLEFSRSNSITSSTNYGFDVQYKIDNLLLRKTSKYHKIEVIENEQFGRMMFLNSDLQIAESDVDIYNKAMVEPLINNNKLHNVAILGGGDGGVLNELLKHNPEKVTLVDIDEDVVVIAREYFPSVCGKAFDQPNVKVVIGDATEFIANNNGFDAVIYDLTMDTEKISNKPKDEFLTEVFSNIQKSLKAGGLFSMQCCSEFDNANYDLVQKLMPRFFKNHAFRSVYIPSYCEPWIFGSATHT